MIIVKLEGGLGNQLFQYAFARSVSSKLETDFRLDTNPFHTYYTLHKYSLNHFNIQEKFARDSDFFGFVWVRKRHKVFNTFYRYLRLKKKLMPFYYPERTFHFDPSVFSKDGVYFDGFWQTGKYFKNIETELRNEIALKEPFSNYSQGIFEEIKTSTAVSIHVRRADYVTNKSSNIYHGTCSMDYYQKAMEYISQRVSSASFFIFSDDYDWAIENFKSLPHPVTCVKNTAEKNYEDLLLMASCKHNIIANSSFSWWGAWLNRTEGKIVIAPKQWFNNVKTAVNTRDIVPEAWIKI
ncbi:MAG TPA: alpha-1,2-fucosyltransferase [Candidatus Paceibacterota bacterium]|nr:alpha-1,2-fucosyltransferase [Candidatus Paceibacterota bacterium]